MELIRKAKEHLILYNPFFAYLALQVEFIEDADVGTTSIDGIIFRYNPEWLNTLDVRQCAALIAHGMSHVLLLHPLRANQKNIEKWNQAADYAVNAILAKSNIQLMNGLFNAEFDKLNTEEIYERLTGDGDNESPDDSSNNGQSGFQQIIDDGVGYENDDGSDICKVAMPDITTKPEKEVESIITQKIMDAATQAESCGTGLTDAIKEVVNSIKEPKKDWRELLYKFTAELARNDYDWQRPDTSYLQRDIYIPGLYNEEIGGVVFAIDTSISVNTELLGIFLSELKEAVAQMTEEVTVIHCDTQVRKVETVQTEEVDKIVPEGRGGTSFLPVFDYIENNDLDPKALIYFTDGKCWDTLTEPNYPVLWLIYENDSFVAQFGESIFVDK